jgi:DtxR family Mn-dependent transcriptional regulator
LPHAARISATLEDYLEAIARLIAEKGAARVNDVANELSVHKSTVTAALKRLARKRLVNYTPYGITTLTPQGREVADRVTRRHATLRDFLVDVLAVDPETADLNACRMEHAVDRKVAERLGSFAKFMNASAPGGTSWAQRFRAYCDADPSAPPADRSAGTLRLSDTAKGQAGNVVAVDCGPALERRLADRGVREGVRFEMVEMDDEADLFEVAFRGRTLKLTRREADGIRVRISETPSSRGNRRHDE